MSTPLFEIHQSIDSVLELACKNDDLAPDMVQARLWVMAGLIVGHLGYPPTVSWLVDRIPNHHNLTRSTINAPRVLLHLRFQLATCQRSAQAHLSTISFSVHFDLLLPQASSCFFRCLDSSNSARAPFNCNFLVCTFLPKV
jgi:hypothetical protein